MNLATALTHKVREPERFVSVFAAEPEAQSRLWPDEIIHACIEKYGLHAPHVYQKKWNEASEWATKTYGRQMRPSTLKRAVAARIGIQFEWRPKGTRSLSNEVLSDCTQHVIVLIAHGARNPWADLVRPLRKRYGILHSRAGLRLKVRRWMAEQLLA